MAKIDLRKEARGRPCQIQLYGVCNHDPETSVLCHLPSGAMGKKADDRHAAIGCSACHDEVDMRTISPLWTRQDILVAFYEGVIRTQKLWMKEGKM